jgi:hypothetical protein
MHRLINSCGQLLERLKSPLGCALEHIGNRQTKPSADSALAERVPVFLAIWVPVEVPHIAGQQRYHAPHDTISTSGDEAQPVTRIREPIGDAERLRLLCWPFGDDLASDGRALRWSWGRWWWRWTHPLDGAVSADRAMKAPGSLPTRPTERSQPVG